MYKTFRKYIIAIPLLLVYVLLGVLGEASLLWCMEPDRLTHLKINYIETCNLISEPAVFIPQKRIIPLSVDSMRNLTTASEKSCFDSLASLGEVAVSGDKVLIDFPHIAFKLTTVPVVSSLISVNISQKFDQTPQPHLQTLTALSTVILLN